MDINKNSIKVVSLIPSLTETLIKCGVNLVGRSRFCIHPQPEIESIPKVAGTKDVDWRKVAKVNPDIIILDKEENTLEMAETCPFEYFALHIQSVEDVAPELEKLSEKLENEKLREVAARWRAITKNKLPDNRQIAAMPGMLEWWKKPTVQKQFLYLIWKDPWMAAGEPIFIQSVLDLLGFSKARINLDEKYPTLNVSDFSPEQTTLLFSSEPYPFDRYKSEMLELGYSCGLIDGELFSWYGIRSLEFLESELNR